MPSKLDTSLMKKLIQINLLLLMLFFFSQKSFAISWPDYLGTKSVATKILKKFPPSEYIYVGVGASPTAVLAYIESVHGSSSVLNLPFSHNSRPWRSYTILEQQSYDANLQSHFEHFIPKDRLQGKRILLIDYASSGRSITYVYDVVQEYIRSRGDNTTVEALGLSGFRPTIDLLTENGIHPLYLKTFMEHQFHEQKFDEYRQFDRVSFSIEGQQYEPPTEITDEVQRQRVRKRYEQFIFPSTPLDIAKKNLERDLKKTKTYSSLIRDIKEKSAKGLITTLLDKLSIKPRPKKNRPRGAIMCRDIF